MRIPVFSALAVLALAGAFALPAEAGAKKNATVYADDTAEHPKSGYYHRQPQVRGYIQRKGGYSFRREDVINTYGDSRVKYGSNNSYRDPFLDRQTRSGPFDHDFFFDSGIAPRGGDGPYFN